MSQDLVQNALYFLALFDSEFLCLEALEKEFKMREEMEVKKIESQVKAQALSDRENREINLEKIRTEAAENRKALLYVFQTISND